MKKIKYYYNTNTLRYEKLETPLRVKLLRVFGFIAAAFVTAAFISFIAFRFVGSPNEKLLQMQNERLKDRYQDLNEMAKAMQEQVGELEKETMTFIAPFLKRTPSLTAPAPGNWKLRLKLPRWKACGTKNCWFQLLIR